MSFIRHIFLSIFFIVNVSSSAETSQSKSPSDTLNTSPAYLPPHNPANITHQEQPLQINKPALFDEEDIEEMEFIFNSCPQEAQLIVKHLQDPSYFPVGKNYRSSFFVGAPGTGKTVMAKAIAYKLAQEGWSYTFISSTSFLGENRNQTATRLERELEKIEKTKKPTIIIIDELHRLLENAESKNHDTDTSSTALWTFLDKQNGNNNFFLIGTMNRINKLPKPFKDRMLFGYIMFPLIDDAKLKNDILRRNLITDKSRFEQDITETFLNKELDRMGTCSGRNLKKMSSAILMQNKLHNPTTPIIIKKESITQAVNSYINQKIEMEYDHIDETDEERQNRFHKENKILSDQHFVQQQMIQMAMHNNQYVEKSTHEDHHYISKDGKEAINSLMSDEQKKYYEQMMANTYARKTHEAQEKAAAEKAAAEEARKNSEEAARIAKENSLTTAICNGVTVLYNKCTGQ